MEYWCGCSREQLETPGFNLYRQCMPIEDYAILNEIFEAVFCKFESIHEEERCKYILSFDLRFVVDGVPKMVHHRLMSYKQINEKIWLALCEVTLTHSKLPGNIILQKNIGRSYDEYCLKTKRWIQRLLPSLSVTEKDILRLIAQGLSCKEIADVLHKSEETIKKHRKNLKYKLQTDNQSMAIVFAMNSGLFLIQ